MDTYLALKMSVHWHVRGTNFNIYLNGQTNKNKKLTYKDLLNLVSKKHNINPEFLYYGEMPENKNLESIIEKENVLLWYDCSKIKEKNMYEDMKFLIPDFSKTYELCILKLNIYVRNENINNNLGPLNYYRNVEKKQITCIAKIIKETENFYIIKFSDYYHINWGRGPSSALPYAALQKNPKYTFPVRICNDFEQAIINYVKEYDNSEYSYCDWELWESYEPEICSICLENRNEIYCYCNNFHLISCKTCIDKLTNCPICNQKILCYNEVKFI